MDWFLYGNGFRHERVKVGVEKPCTVVSKVNQFFIISMPRSNLWMVLLFCMKIVIKVKILK